MRALALGLACSLVLSTTGCAGSLTAAQREQCRELRSRAAGRALAGVIGSVALLGVVVIASAALGRTPNFGNVGRGGRSRRASLRAQRLAACRAPEHPGDPGVVLVLDPEGPVPGEYAPTDIPIAPVPGGPPSATELDEALEQHMERVLACAPRSHGMLYIDARIQGESGAISGLVLGGEGSYGVSVRCVTEALSALRVRPFEGVVDVRWGVEFAPQRP